MLLHHVGWGEEKGKNRMKREKNMKGECESRGRGAVGAIWVALTFQRCGYGRATPRLVTLGVEDMTRREDLSEEK